MLSSYCGMNCQGSSWIIFQSYVKYIGELFLSQCNLFFIQSLEKLGTINALVSAWSLKGTD
jgi:hypothetical protein